MNNLETLFIPEEIKNIELAGKLVVIIDVLRASTTIITALANGCRGFVPILSPDQAKEKAKQFEKERVLLGGEREGTKIEGFDLGNSPREYKREAVKDKIIIFSTTNGVKTLEMVKGAYRIIIGSFLNLQAICNYCANYKGDISIICAGKEGKFSLEDAACAGMLIDSFKNAFSGTYQESDANLTARLLYKKFDNNILEILRKSQHGRYLESIGLGEDLKFCSQLDLFHIVPIFREGIISIKNI
ncbi:MAG: 2-phosphosulfolactate phosphatase [Candidatus Caldatribacteriota bacterium]|nr:2-phosphosulfolactate phosphatase [Candidatus Caldatribacteriota bacterium]